MYILVKDTMLGADLVLSYRHEVKIMEVLIMKRNVWYLSIVFAVLFLAGAAGTAVAAMPAEMYSKEGPIVRIAREASPAVVNIDTETMVQQRSGSPFGGMFPFGDDPFFREFFGDFERYNRMVPMHGKGSGFIVDESGHILTNNHVVEDADKITVTMMDGRKFDATVVGTDKAFDLAIIKIDASDLHALPLGDSDAANVGEWVIAIGNPHGFEHTVTTGIISGKNREVRAADVNFRGFMQTDAAINPGNSGGPLIDIEGNVVGINTAIVPYAQGIGFAVPINMAKQIMDELIKHGSVRRGYLGIVLQNLTEDFADAYDIPFKDGAVVSDVTEGSAGAKAGFRAGDVIVEIDGKKIKNSQDVVDEISGKRTGQKTTITVYRDGRQRDLTATLDERPDSKQSARRDKDGGKSEEQRASSKLGIKVAEIDDNMRERLRLPERYKGVVVTSIDRDAPASRSGLRNGDLILEVNRTRVSNIREWEQAASKVKSAMVLLVYRDGRTLFFTIKDPKPKDQ